jgi:hypothetical protein
LGTSPWCRLAALGALALAACSGDSPESYLARDPCAALTIAAPTATPAQLDGIAAALVLWRDRGVAAFDPAAPAAAPATLEIRFDPAGDAFHGIYDPVADRVLINRELPSDALGIVIAHELGHVFGLTHVAPAERSSLMNPGNLVTPPTDGDQRALESMWGRCR